jgi:hypothetical protein
MKKKGSRKKKVSHPKKENNFFIFKNKVAPLVLALVFLALVILIPFLTTGNAVNATVTGSAGESSNALNQPVTWGWLNSVQWLGLAQPLTLKEFIVFIIVLAIIFVMLLDILSFTSIFSSWVSAVIAGGMAIVASLIGVIRIISVWFITIGAGLGVAAGFLEIGISIVVFIGLAFGSSRIAIFAAKRKAQTEQIKAIKGAGQAGAAITGLKEIQQRFKH